MRRMSGTNKYAASVERHSKVHAEAGAAQVVASAVVEKGPPPDNKPRSADGPKPEELKNDG